MACIQARIVWLWKCNRDPWSVNGDDQWTRYTDIEMEVLEAAHQQNWESVDLDHYRIDLREFVQISKNDAQRTRPVQRRTDIQKLGSLRENRFTYPEELHDKSFNDCSQSDISEFAYTWWKKNSKKINSYADQVEDAAQGIIIAGCDLGKTVEAFWIADQLRAVKEKSWLEISKACIFIYTLDSFLYQILNETLRKNDRSKIDTLGAFCHLLSAVDYASELTKYHRHTGLVYRTAQLTEGQIASYQLAIGKGLKSWMNFTSTSRSRAQAERFAGNVLFIIDIRSLYYGLHIASLSAYPEEEEVLLRASQQFWVQEVDYNKSTKKYNIYVVIEDV